MDGVTKTGIVRGTGAVASRVERILAQYRDRLPSPVRIGNARVWPVGIVDLVRQILAAEARCAGGKR
jgi:hypothetical protein